MAYFCRPRCSSGGDDDSVIESIESYIEEFLANIGELYEAEFGDGWSPFGDGSDDDDGDWWDNGNNDDDDSEWWNYGDNDDDDSEWWNNGNNDNDDSEWWNYGNNNDDGGDWWNDDNNDDGDRDWWNYANGDDDSWWSDDSW